MKIAILTSGRLPVPAVKGGAVENLLDFCLAYNDTHRLHDITVYSMAHPQAEVHEATKSTINHYRFIDLHSIWSKVCKKFHSHHPGYQEEPLRPIADRESSRLCAPTEVIRSAHGDSSGERLSEQ